MTLCDKVEHFKDLCFGHENLSSILSIYFVAITLLYNCEYSAGAMFVNGAQICMLCTRLR